MRYLPLNDKDRAAMLDVIGVDNIDALFQDVPKSARLNGLIDLPLHHCLLYTSPSPRDGLLSRMPSSA